MTQTPNHQPASTPEISPAAARLYSIDKVEEWRTVQHDTLSTYRNSASIEEPYDDFINGIDEQLDDFLRANGLDESDTEYNEIRQIYRDASIDRVSVSGWYSSAESRGLPGDRKAHQVELIEQFDAKLASASLSTDTEATDPTDPAASAAPERTLTDAERQARDAEFAALEAELADARELYAAATAKRQGRLFGKGGKEHDRLKADYEAKLHALGKRHLAEHADYDDDSKKLIATTILFDEQEKLRNLTTEKLEGTKVSKIIAWMNRGSTATRIAKGIGVGVVAGGVGSFLAGAAGAGIIAGGTIAATRFARGFALSDKHRGMQRYEQDSEGFYSGVNADHYAVNADTSAMSDDERMNTFMSRTHQGFEDDTKKEQSKRRKAALAGSALMAGGAVIAYGAHTIGSQYLKDKNILDLQYLHPFGHNDFLFNEDGVASKSSNDGFVSDVLSPMINDAPNGRPEGIPSAEDHDGDGILNGLDEDYDRRTDGGLPNAGDVNKNDIPDVDEPRGDTTPDGDNTPDLVGDTNGNEDVVTVEYGHGYTHELMDFAEANGQHLTPQQAFELHQDLVDQFGEDYIDIDGAGDDIYHQYGDIRLSEPGAGRWEDGVTEFTAKWMDDRGLWTRTAS